MSGGAGGGLDLLQVIDEMHRDANAFLTTMLTIVLDNPQVFFGPEVEGQQGRGKQTPAGAAAGTVDGVHEVFLVTPNCETQKTLSDHDDRWK